MKKLSFMICALCAITLSLGSCGKTDGKKGADSANVEAAAEEELKCPDNMKVMKIDNYEFFVPKNFKVAGGDSTAKEGMITENGEVSMSPVMMFELKDKPDGDIDYSSAEGIKKGFEELVKDAEKDGAKIFTKELKDNSMFLGFEQTDKESGMPKMIVYTKVLCKDKKAFLLISMFAEKDKAKLQKDMELAAKSLK